MMGCLEEYKPAMAMFVLQIASASVTLYTKASLSQGLSAAVYVVYRQAIATLFFAPIAYFSNRRKESKSYLEMRSFLLIFAASLIGVTINQTMFFEGLHLSSSSVAGAMGNIIPATTFVMAAVFRFEKVDIGSLRGIAKIVGTVVCVVGAISMTFMKGSKLLNIELPTAMSVLNSGGENWLMGCLLLFGSSCCWSIWLMLQVPVSASYPDHLSLSAWMSFFALLQSATLTSFLEPNPRSWKLHSGFELSCLIYSGIELSVTFFVQSWCISKRGPLFAAIFNPLNTVIVTILGFVLLHEELHIGSLAGSAAVVIGLYVVLWGKAKDEQMKSNLDPIPTNHITENIGNCKIDLGEPLLAEKPGDNKTKVNN